MGLLNVVLIAFVAFMVGFGSGWEYEHKKLVAFEANVKAVGEAQERHTEEVIQKQKQIAQEAKNDYQNRIAAIRARYGYGLRPNTGSGQLSAPTITTGGANGFPAYGVLVEQCAETTQQLISLQDFIKETSR